MLGSILDGFRQKLGARNIEQKAASSLSLESLFLTGKEIIYGDASGTGGAYSSSWVAYSCIRRIATDASGIPLRLLSDPNDKDSVLPDTHPTVQLFRKPNPYFSSSEFIQWLMTVQQLRGEFFIVFDDPLNPTRMIQYTEPKSWREITDGGEVVAWEYRRGGEHLVEAPSGLIHHRLIDPARPHRGQPPLHAAADAFAIDTGVDMLQRDIVRRGGERAVLYQSEIEVTKRQRDQALEMLQARRTSANKIGRDVLLPNGIKVIDPKFIEDDLRVLEAQKMQPDKICAVYGLSKSLLGIEDIDKYATFAGRMKVYFTQTLIPQLRGIEDAFDSFFAETAAPSKRAYVRFNLDDVPALQEDIGDQFEIAGKAHGSGLPWSVLNDRFKLGLDISEVPGGESVMVPSSLAPLDRLIAEWNPPTPKGDGGKVGTADPMPRSLGGGPGLTNKVLEKRNGDPRLSLQRRVRLHRLEKSVRVEWKKLIGSTMLKAGTTASSIEALRSGTKKKASALLRKHHEQAAIEGEQSIIELTIGKMDDETASVWLKARKWSPEVDRWLDRRENRIVDDTIDDLFDDVKQSALNAAKDGKNSTETLSIIRDRFHSAPGGINRAVTIARTEVGSAYNFARHTEMGKQGYKKSKWITAGDELVRSEDPHNHAKCDGKVRKHGDTFPCGLAYPMEEGGAAANVINCRCETIPVVEV